MAYKQTNKKPNERAHDGTERKTEKKKKRKCGKSGMIREKWNSVGCRKRREKKPNEKK